PASILSGRRSCSPELFLSFFFFVVIRPPPASTLFPYTTLFRSQGLPPRGGVSPGPPLLAGARGLRRSLHPAFPGPRHPGKAGWRDRKSTRLNSSHVKISYAVFCLKKKIRWAKRAQSPVA